MKKQAFNDGDKVRLIRDVDRFPDCLIKAGETGTYFRSNSGGGFYVDSVRLDLHHDELNEWENRLLWDEQCDHGDIVDDVEKLRTSTDKPCPTPNCNRKLLRRRFDLETRTVRDFCAVCGRDRTLDE